MRKHAWYSAAEHRMLIKEIMHPVSRYVSSDGEVIEMEARPGKINLVVIGGDEKVATFLWDKHPCPMMWTDEEYLGELDTDMWLSIDADQVPVQD